MYVTTSLIHQWHENLLAQSDNTFKYWKNMSSICCTIHNILALDMTYLSLIYIINIFHYFVKSR